MRGFVLVGLFVSDLAGQHCLALPPDDASLLNRDRVARRESLAPTPHRATGPARPAIAVRDALWASIRISVSGPYFATLALGLVG